MSRWERAHEGRHVTMSDTMSRDVRMVCLAYSRKYASHCIAGKYRSVAEQWMWIRPVSRMEHGQLTDNVVRLGNGRVPQLLDEIELRLAGPAQHSYQRENQLVDQGSAWLWRGAFPRADLAGLCDSPDTLWTNCGGKNDRIDERVAIKCIEQSLYLIAPEELRLCVVRKQGGRLQARARFVYRGEQHDLAVTDHWVENHRSLQDVTDVDLSGEQLQLCVSLGEPLEGICYKLVAGVIGFAPPVYTIGHSNMELEDFIELLAMHGITAVADVRSSPYSRYVPHFNCDGLRAALRENGISYVPMGEQLGARSPDFGSGASGQVDFARLAGSDGFTRGLERIVGGARGSRIALMCSEKDPLNCHRMILVCRHLRHERVTIWHIRSDGHLEPNADAEQRLMQTLKIQSDMLEDPVERAYTQQSNRIAPKMASEDEEWEPESDA